MKEAGHRLVPMKLRRIQDNESSSESKMLPEEGKGSDAKELSDRSRSLFDPDPDPEPPLGRPPIETPLLLKLLAGSNGP